MHVWKRSELHSRLFLMYLKFARLVQDRSQIRNFPKVVKLPAEPPTLSIQPGSTIEHSRNIATTIALSARGKTCEQTYLEQDHNRVLSYDVLEITRFPDVA
jgi:hypothetical protein